MDTWIIDKKRWEYSKLEWKYFFLLYLLYNKDYSSIPNVYKTTEELEYLEYHNYIRCKDKKWEDITLTFKTKNLFKSKSEVNFDEFWDNFPKKTPNGRLLRPINKEWGGDLTRDYTEAKKKYLASVKTIQIHNKIIEILKAKSKKASVEDKNFENGIIVYINQKKWQKDSIFLEKRVNNFTTLA